MRTVKTIGVTTNSVKGVIIPIDELESMVNQMNRHYIPYLKEHDIRKPPIGRVVHSEVIKLEKEVYGIQSTIEIFEDTDTKSSIKGDGRKIEIKEEDVDSISVVSDEYLRNPDANLFKDLSKITDQISSSEKRSLEPVSILTIIIGVFVLKSFVTGFFEKMGADNYDALKNALINHYKKRKLEEILNFTFTLKGNKSLEINILADPTEENIETFFNGNMEKLRDLIIDIVEKEANLSKIVFEYKNGDYYPIYGIRDDGFPIKI